MLKMVTEVISSSSGSRPDGMRIEYLAGSSILLTRLINHYIFSSCTYPNQGRESLVEPLCKIPNPVTPNDKRPIINSCDLAKLSVSKL